MSLEPDNLSSYPFFEIRSSMPAPRNAGLSCLKFLSFLREMRVTAPISITRFSIPSAPDNDQNQKHQLIWQRREVLICFLYQL